MHVWMVGWKVGLISCLHLAAGWAGLACCCGCEPMWRYPCGKLRLQLRGGSPELQVVAARAALCKSVGEASAILQDLRAQKDDGAPPPPGDLIALIRACVRISDKGDVNGKPGQSCAL